jgi:hypothetical protein
MKVCEIRGAYIGAHCEVRDGNRRVFPPDKVKPQHDTGRPLNYGTNRDACEGFIAGVKFAKGQS